MLTLSIKAARAACDSMDSRVRPISAVTDDEECIFAMRFSNGVYNSRAWRTISANIVYNYGMWKTTR